jgi:hypothetical protein
VEKSSFRSRMAYRRIQNAKARIIPIMAESKIAALVISMGHYLQQIPPLMVEAANRLNFPIIEVPGYALCGHHQSNLWHAGK